MFVEIFAATLAASLVQEQPSIVMPASGTERTEERTQGSVSPETWAMNCEDWDDWDKPAPPFVVHPRVHYVGTCGISALLVVTRSGNVLLDTGTRPGAEVVLANIDKSLVERKRIRIILTSHEHFDHVGGLAHVQKVTGAPALVSPLAADVLRTGVVHSTDPQSGMHDPMEPAEIIVPIVPGEKIAVGDVEFLPIETPGHTPGALSWQWEMCEEIAYTSGDDKGNCVSIVYADSLSPVSSDTYKFSDSPEYIAAYRAGLQRLREVECDILLTPHPSASKMIERARTGSMLGGMTCAQYADAVEARLDARLAKEAAE